MKPKAFCSFCEGAQTDRELLIAAPDGASFICNECITLCAGIAKDHSYRDVEYRSWFPAQ